MTALAWVFALGSFAALVVALQVGPGCAVTAGPYCAAAFFVSWLWLAYQYERRRR